MAALTTLIKEFKTGFDMLPAYKAIDCPMMIITDALANSCPTIFQNDITLK